MEAAQRFVASLLAAREEDEQRREDRRRRRIDFISAGNRERAQRSKDLLSGFLQRSTTAMSRPEHDFFGSLGDIERWWDLISRHILEEKRECEEAVRLQGKLRSMYLTTTLRREEREQTVVMGNDERRLQELEEWCLAEEARARDEAVGEVMRNVLAAFEQSVDFVEKHALEGSAWNTLLSDIAVNNFVQGINGTHLTREEKANVAFARIFKCHPFQITSDEFLYLLCAMYKELEPCPSSLTCFDLSRRPLFLMDGPKFSGKTVASRDVSMNLSLLSLSDRELVNKAMQAYRQERDGLPTLLTREDSDALPVLLAYEERKEHDEEIAYHSEGHVEQFTESFVRLSPRAKIGKSIESSLFGGEPVDPSLIVQLMQLEIADPTLNCEGILFDGTVTGLDELHFLRSVIPENVHRFEGALRNFPPCKKDEVSLTSDLLVVKREVRPEGGNGKSEPRPKPPKKGVDLSALPPPVLPEVTHLDLTEEEKDAIQLWEQQARTYPFFFAVVHILCGPHEIFRRFAGLRIDKETHEQYHMVFDPPPPERLPYVVSLDRVKTSTAQLHRVLLNQQWNWNSIQRWLKHEGGGMDILYEVNGEQPLENIKADVQRILQEAKEKFKAGLELYDAAMAAKKRKAYIEANYAQQQEERENERKRLVAVYTECGAPIPPQLELRPQPTPFYTMPNDFPEYFMRAFMVFRTQYENAYAWLATSLEKLTNVILEYRCEANNVFYRFCSQPDEKQEKLDRFLENYNRVPITLLGQASCKEELHLLVDQLREDLFRVVDATGKDARAKIELLTKKESFLSPWSVSVCNIGIAAVQVEAERFLATMNLVVMYFGAVVNEPCIFEEMESEAIIIRSLSETAVEQTKGKEKKAQGAKKAPRLEEVVEKTLEDTFVENIGKLVTALENFVEKLSSIITASMKGRENGKSIAAAAEDGKTPYILKKCLPFAESELNKARERISYIRQFFLQIQHEGEIYASHVKEDMVAYARVELINQSSAVNTAIYIIRNAIEEERSLAAMHLGRDTFHTVPVATVSPSRNRPLSPQQLQVPTPSEEVKIHATLSFLRLVEIIQTFRSVAPDYALGRAEFVHILRPTDYAGAAITSTRNIDQLKSLEEVFASFDPLECGLIDWREFVVHLLFWCAPPPEVGSTANKEENYYIPESSITQLLETRTDLGLEAISEDVFFDVPFFFDSYLDDKRLEAYVRALWMTFSEDGLLDPLPLLALLCIDLQPIRGAQKAFYVLSREQDGTLSAEELDSVFHIHVTNPRNMCIPDVFSPENIAMLYGGNSSLSFESVCERVIGRTMLNNTEVFHRKFFIFDDLHVE